MNVVTAEQMRELDRRAMDEAGIPGVVLMENAGRAVVDALQREFGAAAGRYVGVFCGAGNNGGDGFVIARLLRLAGAEVVLFCANYDLDPARLKPDSAVHLRVAQHGAHLQIDTLPDESELEDKSGLWPRRFELAVDALLGTGVQSAPRGWYAHAIRAVNTLRCPVIAVDIPSGVDADTGACPGEAVRADLTVTFAYPKRGLFLSPGHELTGKLHVADIGFEWRTLHPASDNILSGCNECRNSSGLSVSPSLLEPSPWTTLLQKRRPESNKGDYGHVGIIAGSRGMAGAPALCARAAQRSGAGLVTVLSPESIQPILAGKLDEQMTVALAEADGALSGKSWESILRFASRATTFCVGPGLTTSAETVEIVLRILREIDLPIILDADGLNALSAAPGVASERASAIGNRLILTPHPGEASRLLATSIPEIQADRFKAVRQLAAKYQATVVLKGRFTLVADPTGRVAVNTTGNPGMAAGGMGDALTGIIGALVAQDSARAKKDETSGMDAFAAVTFAVHLHGLAGDIAARTTGESGVTAGDLIAALPGAFSQLTQ